MHVCANTGQTLTGERNGGEMNYTTALSVNPVNVRSKMTQPRTNCNIINFYGKVFRKNSGIPQKKSTKI